MAWNRYPSYTNLRLVERLSAYLNVPPNHLLVGNGSNELLQTVISVVLSAGKKLLLVTPTFQIYQQLGKVAEAEICQIEFEEDWSFPIEKILRLLKEKTIELCILCSPNSPTGSTLNQDDLKQICETARGLILVDEAYHEFSKINYLELQAYHKNLILTRTFSKAMGLAGLRIGYLIADADLIREIHKAKLPYNLNIFSELVASKLLDHQNLLQQNIQKIVSEKERIGQKLFKLKGVTVFPSQANFFMIATSIPAPALFEKLLNLGLLVRDISSYHPRLQNTLRITVGMPAENDALINALQISRSQID